MSRRYSLPVRARPIRLLCAVLGLCLLLTACSGGGGSNPASGSNWDQMNWDQGKWA